MMFYYCLLLLCLLLQSGPYTVDALTRSRDSRGNMRAQDTPKYGMLLKRPRDNILPSDVSVPRNKPDRKQKVKMRTEHEASYRKAYVSPLSEKAKATLKAIAIVFPQYHPIPENDRFWGKGFTEWTMLRPMPRMVNNIVTRFPHEDIGYYSFLDIEHRRYMRSMADHFGIFGFCFYHYWFKGGPVMHKPLDLLLIDNEPDKPFFLAWANEPWTKRWDGLSNDVLLAQDYLNETSNIEHFQYLLPLFKHKNYIMIDECPIFAFYRVDEADVAAISRIIELWLQLATAAGLKGIFFLRFLGSFPISPSSVKLLPEIAGHIQFEPMLSGHGVGGGPSIFTDETFNLTEFRGNNPDLVNLSAIKHYERESPREKLFRSSQFKVYDKELTWAKVENKPFSQYKNTFRGTSCHWSNAPRRNFTNGDYSKYPHMMSPSTVSGCKGHLKRLTKVVLKDPLNFKDKFLFLTAWNEWNEQSVLEPTDVDGYEVLSAVKDVMRVNTRQKIQHICHRGGGTEKYIQDLMKLFSHYEHIFTPFVLPDPTADTALLHIHSGMVGAEAPLWDTLLKYIRGHKHAGIRVCVTVHDYQWLFPLDPNPTLQVIDKLVLEKENRENTLTLFNLADVVIFPSQHLKNFYFNMLYTPATLPSRADRFPVVVHNDILSNPARLRVPLIRQKVINIAFIGVFLPYKGSEVFLELVAALSGVTFSPMSGDDRISLAFHVFGAVQKNENCVAKHCTSGSTSGGTADVSKLIQFHGPYLDSGLPLLLEQFNVHVLLYLSPCFETYCYALTPGINTGLPIVYLNQGALTERLTDTASPRFFPATPAATATNVTVTDVAAAVSMAVKFTISQELKEENMFDISSVLQPTKWYISNYPNPRNGTP